MLPAPSSRFTIIKVSEPQCHVNECPIQAHCLWPSKPKLANLVKAIHQAIVDILLSTRAVEDPETRSNIAKLE